MKETEIKQRLLEHFNDAEVQVEDPRGSGDYFNIYILTEAFSGLSRIKCHQAIMQVFDKELKSGEIHALSIKAGSKS